jgi:surface polysaccharide O-acyltransferase-like enzyme
MIIWIMPLFFMLSGFGTRYALQRRSGSAFVTERLLRLGVPLLVGAFVLSPFQVYSERVTTGAFTGSFAAFLPHYFEGWYSVTPGGNFAWMGLHLWFLLVLLLFSLVTLPFFLLLRGRKVPFTVGPAGVLLLTPLLIFTLEGVLFALGLDASQTGWMFGVYLAYYVLGYGLLPGEQFRAAVRKYGLPALVGVVVTTVPLALLPEPTGFSAASVAYNALKCYSCWLWVVGLFYLGDRYLSQDSPALRYCGEAVMPFYVLHQPIIVGLGFAVRNVALPVAVKLPLLLATAFVLIVLCYHLLVRPFNAVRFLFGMKPRHA